MSAAKIVMVTGAARGIGKELVHQLAQSGNIEVIATVRKPIVFDLKNVKTISFDQTSTPSVEAAATDVTELDTLIVNGAIGDDESLLSSSEDRFQDYLNTNVTGFLRIVKAFLPALRARKTRRIIFISSIAGSITHQVDATFGLLGPYAVTKAAGNMVMVQLHNELHAKEGFVVAAIHPGWVATDMGAIAGSGGIPAADAVKLLLKVIERLTPDDSAKFLSYDGSLLPW